MHVKRPPHHLREWARRLWAVLTAIGLSILVVALLVGIFSRARAVDAAEAAADSATTTTQPATTEASTPTTTSTVPPTTTSTVVPTTTTTTTTAVPTTASSFTNGDAETGATDPWQTFDGASFVNDDNEAEAHGGSRSFLVNPTRIHSGIETQVPVLPSTRYVWGAWINEATAGGCRYTLAVSLEGDEGQVHTGQYVSEKGYVVGELDGQEYNDGCSGGAATGEYQLATVDLSTGPSQTTATISIQYDQHASCAASCVAPKPFRVDDITMTPFTALPATEQVGEEITAADLAAAVAAAEQKAADEQQAALEAARKAATEDQAAALKAAVDQTASRQAAANQTAANQADALTRFLRTDTWLQSFALLGLGFLLAGVAAAVGLVLLTMREESHETQVRFEHNPLAPANEGPAKLLPTAMVSGLALMALAFVFSIWNAASTKAFSVVAVEGTLGASDLTALDAHWSAGWLFPLQVVGLGVILVGIVLGMIAIVEQLRFNGWRLRDMASLDPQELPGEVYTVTRSL